MTSSGAITSEPSDVHEVQSDTVVAGTDGRGVAIDGVEAKIDRYVVLEQLGSGGMGRVVRAYDPKLGREVALKLLKARSEQATARLMREAQAMAQLSHPNVLPVFDVGEHDGGVFIAMEFVHGQTLRRWLGTEPRRYAEIVTAYAAAGEGLAAAHAAGLVHRDFKPENVLRGRDGRVRVLDFGLARATTDASTDDAIRLAPMRLIDSREPDEVSLSAPLTRDGRVMGTPLYMAPEQHRGRAADERSDQYSFCVALFEALYGERPFRGDTTAELCRVKERGAPMVTVDAGPVPRHVHRAVMRGLAPEPVDRWPSMTALLAELHRNPRRMRRRVGLAVVSIGLVAAVALVLGERRDRLCTGAGERLAGIWDDPTVHRVRTAFDATALPYADETFRRVRSQLDAYAVSLVDSHRDACEATRVRGDQSEALMDARIRCLEGRLWELSALSETLATADAQVVERAVQAASGLPKVSRCDESEYVQAQVLPPDDPAKEARVDAARERLAQSRVLARAGKYDEARRVATDVVHESKALDYPPLLALARFELGAVEHAAGHYVRAEAALRAAFFEGRRSGMDEVAAGAATELVLLLAEGGGKPDEAQRWAEHARVEVARFADAQGRASLLEALGTMHDAKGEYDRALDRLEQSLAVWQVVVDADDPKLGVVHHRLGATCHHRGDYAESFAHHRQALEQFEAAYGPAHPMVASALESVGRAELALGRHDDALAHHERALAIRTAQLGAQHPKTGHSLDGIGRVYAAMGRFDEAIAYERRAVAALEPGLGPRHRDVATASLALARALLDAERSDEAVEHAEQALVVLAEIGAPAEDLAAARFVVAKALAATGSADARALTLAREALEQWRSLDGPRSQAQARLAEAWLHEHDAG